MKVKTKRDGESSFRNNEEHLTKIPDQNLLRKMKEEYDMTIEDIAFLTGINKKLIKI